jgi:sulfide:quinone oxidoreductase
MAPHLTQPERRARRAEVVIAGGAVAALEALLALHELAAERIHVTLVAPEPELVLRPFRVAEPFRLDHPTRHPLAPIAADLGASHVRDGIASIDGVQRVARLTSGRELRYDSLIVATGARAVPAFRHAITIGEDAATAALEEILSELEDDRLRRLAFVVPSPVGWTLPVYELALLTAAEARGIGVDDARIMIVSAEERPLALFGAAAVTRTAQLLALGGIEFEGASRADVHRGLVTTWPGGRMFAAERTLALPLLQGPALRGLPCDDQGFIPVDAHGRVRGVAGAFAAGDATTFPVKQGGLAAQQAEAAAQSVAARHGCDVRPRPFRPVLEGRLTTADGELYLRHAIAGGGGEGEASERPLWSPPTKIAAPRLGTYLLGAAERRDARTSTPAGFH